MEKVLEVLNDKLVEYENRIDYLRNEKLRLETENKKLTTENELLVQTVAEYEKVEVKV